ncbi:MAG: sulfurtransferase complex subunit TusB [Chromatiales bacterium]|nr:sulfurtransferase complex subunit TusB [Chromatiales bacterium]
MSILHTVNRSPFERNSLNTCLGYALPGSAILFYEDGVYAGLKGAATESQVAAATKDRKVYVLGPDLSARGFGADQLIDGIEVVDYAGFVDLAASADKVQAWL